MSYIGPTMELIETIAIDGMKCGYSYLGFVNFCMYDGPVGRYKGASSKVIQIKGQGGIQSHRDLL